MTKELVEIDGLIRRWIEIIDPSCGKVFGSVQVGDVEIRIYSW